MSDTEQVPEEAVEAGKSVPQGQTVTEIVEENVENGEEHSPVGVEEDEEDAVDSDSDSDALSELDEEQFREDRIPVDEDVYKIKTKKRAAPRKAGGPKEQRRSRTRKPAQESVPEEEDEQERDPAVAARRELEARIDAALKPAGKRRKLAGDDLEQMQDEKIAQLRDEMRHAALRDVECIRNSEPALNKVRLLPEVVDILNKHALADSILDGNLLESVRIWLEPLPDASLPSYEIQKEMFHALTKLPVKTIHLRESGLGRVVLFYQKSKRPHPQIKRTADRLIGDWTRPIMGRSDNYRDKQVRTASYDPEEAPEKGARGRESLTLAEESALRRNRAAIPTARGDTYDVAPQNMVMASGQARASGESQLRKMKTKLMQASRQQKGRKSQVSIEGRGLH